MTRFENRLPPPLPPALYAETERAGSRAVELASQDRQIHFAFDAAGRLLIELRTLDGRTLGRITAASALDIIGGAGLGEGVRPAGPERD